MCTFIVQWTASETCSHLLFNESVRHAHVYHVYCSVGPERHVHMFIVQWVSETCEHLSCLLFNGSVRHMHMFIMFIVDWVQRDMHMFIMFIVDWVQWDMCTCLSCLFFNRPVFISTWIQWSCLLLHGSTDHVDHVYCYMGPLIMFIMFSATWVHWACLVLHGSTCLSWLGIDLALLQDQHSSSRQIRDPKQIQI